MRKYKQYILYTAVISILLSFVCIDTSTSASSYESSIGIGFTFNPTLSISLSSSDLIISNLTPGSNADSNSINVSVATNAAYGYTLSVNSSSNYLTHSNNIDTFSSIATNADLSSLNDSENNNIWGYNTSLDNGSSWSNYNGLSSSNNTVLLDNSNTADSTGSIDFKIGAKAGSAQASGIYTNTINFIVVPKVAPMSLLDSFIASEAEQLNGYYKMQDMTHDICNNVDIEESELQLIDVRDNKIYWVAKLKDGNCWMTQNLDLDLSSSVALTSETSDIDPESYGKTIYTAETGYTEDEATGIVSWLPSTIDENGIQRADTIEMVWNGDSATVPGWTNDNNHPYSANAGTRYRYTNNSGDETVYTSFHNCLNGTNNDITGCQHTYLGNYYNWSAMVASNNTDDASENQKNSICSKNWMPSNNDFNGLTGAYNIKSANALNLRSYPLYFVRSGILFNKLLYSLGVSGYYWSNAARDTTAYGLRFLDNSLYVAGIYDKYYGFSVRCLAR